MRWTVRTVMLVSAIVAGCSGATIGPLSGTGVSPVVTPDAVGTDGTLSPAPSEAVTSLELVDVRYELVDQVGRPLFCDPDFYPVARFDETTLANERLQAIRADAASYALILRHLGIDPAGTLTAAQVLAIYREWKMLRAVVLEVEADGHAFDYVAASAAGGQQGWHVTGTIDAKGTINLTRRDPSGPPPCPICLARGTLIATPTGQIRVEDVRAGIAVWTADASGLRIPGVVLLVGSTLVPATHEVVHLVLADGRILDASPGHPLPDGRRLGDLRPGDAVDGALVASAELVPYVGGSTFDLLPSGPTGTYWADGVPLGSTLRQSP